MVNRYYPFTGKGLNGPGGTFAAALRRLWPVWWARFSRAGAAGGEADKRNNAASSALAFRLPNA
jgi:hypothetical protein